MVRVLGGKCCDCGATTSLTFDCNLPAGPRHHGMSVDQRSSFYLSQLRKGNLRLRCRDCNSLKRNMCPGDWTAFRAERAIYAQYLTNVGRMAPATDWTRNEHR
jgi:hypothetical protein